MSQLQDSISLVSASRFSFPTSISTVFCLLHVDFHTMFILIFRDALFLYYFTCSLLMNVVFLIIAENRKRKKQGRFYFVEIFAFVGYELL